ncbi:hypothetical protein B296_00045192 [Ensete ventricosum]|uniref:Uncharacterized protein n=1 Tax=Ensete ventricosum TaxID=4639 RepID=A0A426YDE7_ENSVE|nr:hypothetical protein B296_00045192 [Ensete ventricosum]
MQSNSIDWTGSLESSVTPFGRPLVRVRHWRRALLVREALMATSSMPPSSCTKNLLIRSTAVTERREQDPKAQRTMACSCLPLLAHHSKTRLVHWSRTVQVYTTSSVRERERRSSSTWLRVMGKVFLFHVLPDAVHTQLVPRGRLETHPNAREATGRTQSTAARFTLFLLLSSGEGPRRILVG